MSSTTDNNNSVELNVEDILNKLGLKLKLPDGMTANDLPESVIQELISELYYKEELIKNSRKKLNNINTINDIISLINKSNKILVLTGAGISVSAGIPDFRSENGLYKTLKKRFNLNDPTTMFDMEYFMKDPLLFYSFGDEICPGFDDKIIKYYPTKTHYFIKILQNKGKLLRNYTQNIDTLEMRAGIDSNKLITCHGSYVTATCVTCEFQVSGIAIQEHIFNKTLPLCPYCHDKSDLKEWKRELNVNEIESLNKLRNPVPFYRKLNDNNGFMFRIPKYYKNELNNVSLLWEYKSKNIIDISRTEIKDGTKYIELYITLKNDTNNNNNNNNINDIVLDKIRLILFEWIKTFKSYGVFKPDIVFFHEPLSDNFHDTIQSDVKETDLVFVMGTSLQVHPVALIPSQVPKNIPMILINREIVGYPNEFDVNLLGNCDDVCETLLYNLDWNMISHIKKNESNNINDAKTDDIEMKNDNNNNNSINDDINAPKPTIKPIPTKFIEPNNIKCKFIKNGYYLFPNGKMDDINIESSSPNISNNNDNNNNNLNENNPVSSNNDLST